MPWRSKAQARWGHSAAGKKALGGASAVTEWDSATDWSRLPERRSKAMGPKIKSYMKRAAAKRVAGGSTGARKSARDQSKSKRWKRGRHATSC